MHGSCCHTAEPADADASGAHRGANVTRCGRVDVSVAHAYTLGVAANIPISVRTTRGMITGPLAARVVATRQPRP